MFTRKNIVAYTFLLTVVYQICIGTGSAQSLRYLVGIHQTYQVGDPSVKLQWLLLPSGAAIYFLRCNHSSSFGEPTKVVYSNSDIASGPFNISGWWRNRRFEAVLQRDSFTITIFNPQSQHQGWYFCEINTIRSADITGAVKLSRQIENLTSVQANDGTFNHTQKSANLTWQYVSKDASIKGVSCLFQSIDTRQWKTIAIYNVGQDEFETYYPFKFRLGYNYEKQKGMFVLLFRNLDQEDQGLFLCEFTAAERKVSVSAVSKLVYVPEVVRTPQATFSAVSSPRTTFSAHPVTHVASTGHKPKTGHSQKITFSKCFSSVCVGLLVGLFLVGFGCGAGMVYMYVKRKKKPALNCCNTIKKMNKKENGTVAEGQKLIQDFIAVTNEEKTTCLHLGEDNTLNLETLQTYFPMAIGLTKKTAEKSSKKDRIWGIRCTCEKLYPPKDGWGDEEYHIVCRETQEKNMPMVDIKAAKLKEEASEKRRESRIDTTMPDMEDAAASGSATG